jgi:cytochrome P450
MSGSVPAWIVSPGAGSAPLRLLRTVVDNPIKAWPRAIYRERIVRSRVLGRDTVYVMAPDLIRQMLADETDNFEKGEIARRGLGPVLGDAILTADGSRWRWQRHAAASIFRQERIRSFLPATVGRRGRTHARSLDFLSSWRRDRRRARNDADNVRHYSQHHTVRAEQHRL